MVFYIPFSGDPNYTLEVLKERARLHGVILEGTTLYGTFSGWGVDGQYWFLDQVIKFQIDKKPWGVNVAYIKNFLEGILGEFI